MRITRYDTAGDTYYEPNPQDAAEEMLVYSDPDSHTRYELSLRVHWDRKAQRCRCSIALIRGAKIIGRTLVSAEGLSVLQALGRAYLRLNDKLRGRPERLPFELTFSGSKPQALDGVSSRKATGEVRSMVGG